MIPWCAVVLGLLLRLIPAESQAGYNLTTLVGATSAMFSGNGGPASSARIFAPTAIAVNVTTGSYLISDSSNGVVRLVLPNGTITAFAGIGCYGCCSCGNSGDGPATSVKLNYPGGIALDGFAGAYIADKSNQCVNVPHHTFEEVTSPFVLYAALCGEYSRTGL